MNRVTFLFLLLVTWHTSYSTLLRVVYMYHGKSDEWLVFSHHACRSRQVNTVNTIANRMKGRMWRLSVIPLSVQWLSCVPINCIVNGQMLVYLILFEICSNSPTLDIGKSVSVLLKQGVDTRDSTVPRVLQIFQGQTPEERTYKILTAKTSFSWQF